MKHLPALLLLVVVSGFLSAKEKTPVPTEGQTIKLDSFDVRGRPVSSFPITIRVEHNVELKKTRLTIVYVTPDSDADKQGLRAGDEIVRIDGEAVEDMDPRVSKYSQLGKLLLNRKSGERLDLDVVTRRVVKVALRANTAVPATN